MTESPFSTSEHELSELPSQQTGEVQAAGGNPSPAPGFGERLRVARQAQGLDIATCAQGVRLPARILRKLESDNHDDLDSEVYLRGYLSKYGGWLGLPQAMIDEEIARLKPQQPTLVSSGGITHSRYLFDRYATAATYLVLTAVIIVPVVWLGLKGGLDREIVHLAPLDASPVVQQDAAALPTPDRPPANRAATDVSAARKTANERPLLASMAPFAALDNADAEPAQPAAATKAVPGTHSMTIELPAPSWVEVVAADGQRLEYDLLPAGTEKTYRSTQPLEVRIGNADDAQVSIDGKPVALDAYRHANVAHFRVALKDGQATAADM
jgi:cytoskeleton protein RodZ